MFTVWFCLAAALIASASSVAVETTNLTIYLLRNYDKLSVPGGAVKVNLTMRLVNFDFEGSDIGKWDVWMSYAWIDKRLTWTPSNWGGIDKVYLPSSKIWRPDIVLYNGVKPTEELPVNSVILSTGLIYYIPQVRMYGRCESESHYRSCVCNLRMGSWTYDASALNVSFANPDSGISLDEYFPNRDVEIVNCKATRNVKTYPNVPEKYISMDFWVHLRRDFFMQRAQFVFLAFVALLAPLVFLTKRRQKLRLTLCIVNILSFALGCLIFHLTAGVGNLSYFKTNLSILVLMLVCFIVHLLPRYSDGLPICLRQCLVKSKPESKQEEVGLKGETEQQQQQQEDNKAKCLLLGPIVDAVCFGLSLIVSLILLMKA